MQIPPEINHDPNGHEEALYAALRQAEEEKNSRYQKAWKYFDEWGNRVSVLTLLFVAAYTIVTFDIFFVGNRAFIYFDKAVGQVLDQPVDPERGDRLAVFNGPWVTHKVISLSFLLTNAGNTPTRNMRVILDCRPFGFMDLQKIDPFTSFKWDEKIAHPEIVGPKQTIEVGPCEAEAKGETVLNAQMGVAPMILMGEIRYEDRVAWGSWAKHATQFCQRLSISSIDVDAKKISASTQSIGRHNCADEDCPND
jgi:hypothetical protein